MSEEEEQEENEQEQQIEAWQVIAFVDAHPEWKSVRGQLSIQLHNNGWTHIFYGMEIGRVKIVDRFIIAESFITVERKGE